MNPEYKVSNIPGNKSEGRYLISCSAVFASKATQDDSVDCLILFSSSVFSLSSVSFSTACWLHSLILMQWHFSQPCEVLWKTVTGKTPATCLWLWSQHSSRDLDDSARCQGVAYISMIPLLPSASPQIQGPLRNYTGQANKTNSNHPDDQIPCFWEPLEVGGCPLNTFSRQFPWLGWSRKIRERGVRRMLCQATLWRGRWKVKCSLFLQAQRPGRNLVSSNHDEPTCGAGATWLSVSWGSSAFLPSGSSPCPWRASPGCTCRARGSAQHHPGSAFPAPHWKHAGAHEAPQTWSSHSTQGWSCVLHVWSASSSASRTDASVSPWQKHLCRKLRETPY